MGHPGTVKRKLSEWVSGRERPRDCSSKGPVWLAILYPSHFSPVLDIGEPHTRWYSRSIDATESGRENQLNSENLVLTLPPLWSAEPWVSGSKTIGGTCEIIQLVEVTGIANGIWSLAALLTCLPGALGS